MILLGAPLEGGTVPPNALLHFASRNAGSRRKTP